jgi:hypothetical protein
MIINKVEIKWNSSSAVDDELGINAIQNDYLKENRSP